MVIGWSIGGSGGIWVIVVVAVEMDNRCQAAVVMDKENFVLEVLHKQKNKADGTDDTNPNVGTTTDQYQAPHLLSISSAPINN